MEPIGKAISEADRDGLICFVMAIDPTTKQFLPRLFGNGNFEILKNLELMPDTLTQFCTKYFIFVRKIQIAFLPLIFNTF